MLWQNTPHSSTSTLQNAARACTNTGRTGRVHVGARTAPRVALLCPLEEKNPVREEPTVLFCQRLRRNLRLHHTETRSLAPLAA